MTRRQLAIPAFLLLCLGAAATAAANPEDVRGIALPQQGLKVIEEKCLVCHNRKRIDEAVRKREELAKIMGRMEQKGARLTERDRMVIGHFWNQTPFREKESPTVPPAVPLK